MLEWAVQGVIRLPMSPMVLYQTPRFYVFTKLDLGITYHHSFGLSATSSLGRTDLFIYSGKVTQQREDVSRIVVFSLEKEWLVAWHIGARWLQPALQRASCKHGI